MTLDAQTNPLARPGSFLDVLLRGKRVSVGRLKAVMVFSFVASRVRLAVSAIATLFTPHPTPPEMDYVLPLTDLRLQVDQWATLALIPGPSRDIAKHTFVIGATQYKSRTKKEHEKLLVILQTPRVGSTPSAITYVVTERGPDPDDMSAKRRQNSSMLPSPMGSSSNLPLSLTDVRANDLIFVPGTRRYQPLDSYKKQLKEKHDILCTVTLTTPMSLAQLAVLLKAVNQHSVDYDLWTYQCYWYAYTIWEVLRTQYGGTVTENKLQDRRGKYMGVKIRREDSVEAINEKYGKAWQTFCDEETRARQRAEEAARQLAQEAIQQAEVRGEARGVAQERARNQDVLRELDAYRKAIGPLPK